MMQGGSKGHWLSKMGKRLALPVVSIAPSLAASADCRAVKVSPPSASLIGLRLVSSNLPWQR